MFHRSSSQSQQLIFPFCSICFTFIQQTGFLAPPFTMCIVKRSKIDVSRTVVQALFTIGELWQVFAVLTVLIHKVRALNMYSSFVHTNFALIPSHHNEYECKEFFLPLCFFRDELQQILLDSTWYLNRTHSTSGPTSAVGINADWLLLGWALPVVNIY